MTMSTRSRLILLVMGLPLLGGAGSANPAGICFGPGEQPSLPIIENAPPPKVDGQADYKFYPASIYASMDLQSLVTSHSTTPKMFWQWANHGPRRVEKGNLAPGVAGKNRPVVVDFSSPAAADACTLAQTAAVIGADPAAFARSGHLTLVQAIPQQSETIDTCILPTQKLPSGMGVLLDYEVQDGRSPQETATFLTSYAAAVHASGRKVYLYTNPLDAPSQRLTGIDGGNAPRIALAFDLTSILLWSGNREGDVRASYANQAHMLGAPMSRAFIVFELQGTTMRDAAAVRQIALADRPAAIAFWRNGAQTGGDCSTPVNRKIACVAFGRCTN